MAEWTNKILKYYYKKLNYFQNIILTSFAKLNSFHIPLFNNKKYSVIVGTNAL